MKLVLKDIHGHGCLSTPISSDLGHNNKIHKSPNGTICVFWQTGGDLMEDCSSMGSIFIKHLWAHDLNLWTFFSSNFNSKDPSHFLISRQLICHGISNNLTWSDHYIKMLILLHYKLGNPVWNEALVCLFWWHGKLECGTWYHHPRSLRCLLSRNLRIFKVATWHRCRHNLKNNCIWDNLQCCLLVPRSPGKPVMLTFDLQSRKV